MDPEPGVFRDMAKGASSNDKNSRPGAEKGPSSEDGQKTSFPLLLFVFPKRNLIGPSISPRRTLLKSRCGFCSLAHFALCILSKSMAGTIRRLGKASPCTDVVGKSLFFSNLPEERGKASFSPL